MRTSLYRSSFFSNHFYRAALQDTVKNDLVRLVGVPEDLGTQRLGEGQEVGKLAAQADRCQGVFSLNVAGNAMRVLSVLEPIVLETLPEWANRFAIACNGVGRGHTGKIRAALMSEMLTHPIQR